MANNPIFPFYVNDFEGGTRHMTDAEVGCYLRLLLAQFNRGGVLPEDENFLSRFCTSFKESWPIVKEKFHQVENGFQNKRLEHERVKRQKFVLHQSENGKRGGRPIKPNNNPNQNPNETQIKPNQKPLGKGKGIGKGNEDGIGNLKEGGTGEEKFIVPQMCRLWYENFPTYTADKEQDFTGMGSILRFISNQTHAKEVSEKSTQEQILTALQQIANQVKLESFWSNKPIKSIANNIQEFCNKIKNQTNGKQFVNSRQRVDAVQAELKSRLAKRQQSGNNTGVAEV